MFKMIVTDLDNTLLRRDKSISDYTVQIFERCRAAGILIAFATSRSESASARFTKVITPDIFISNGGALARCGDEVLYEAAISDSDVGAIIAKLVDCAEVRQITLQSEKGYFDSKPLTDEVGWVDYADSIETDFRKPIDFGAVYKITVLTESAAAVSAAIAGHREVDMIGFNGEDWVQIKNSKGSKEAAIVEVAQKLNIMLNDIVVFGDDMNDLGMLKIAGTSVAMSNAIPEVKECVQFICGDCDEDGVAYWLENQLTGKLS